MLSVGEKVWNEGVSWTCFAPACQSHNTIIDKKLETIVLWRYDLDNETYFKV